MNLPTTPSFRLDGKRAFVTGASRGIGLGCAVALAQSGAHVVGVARGGDALAKSIDAMKNEGLSAQGVVLDICDQDALEDFFTQQDAFDVVVNAAGTARHSAAVDTKIEDYDAVMSTNLRAAYFLSILAAKGMKEKGNGGAILHISSQMGHVGGVDRAVYCATKHGLEGMIKSFAIEWGPDNIRVNSICPTFIRTPLTEPTFADPKRVAWIKEKIKLGRIGEVEDIMGAVAFLASDAASLITGTSLLIDGGWTAD